MTGLNLCAYSHLQVQQSTMVDSHYSGLWALIHMSSSLQISGTTQVENVLTNNRWNSLLSRGLARDQCLTEVPHKPLNCTCECCLDKKTCNLSKKICHLWSKITMCVQNSFLRRRGSFEKIAHLIPFVSRSWLHKFDLFSMKTRYDYFILLTPEWLEKHLSHFKRN